MTELTVKFIDDSSVRHVITASRSASTQENFLHVNTPRDTVLTLRSLKPVQEDEEEIEEEYTAKPTALLEDSAIQHFGFSTPKKKASLRETALSTLKLKNQQSPSTPRNGYGMTTPKARRSSMGSTPIPSRTPTSLRKSRRSLTPIISSKTSTRKQINTPSHLRKTVKTRIQQIAEESSTDEEECDDSDNDFTYRPTDESSEDDVEPNGIFDLNDNITPRKLTGTPRTKQRLGFVTPSKTGTPRKSVRRSLATPRRPAAKIDVDMTDTLDDYFTNADPKMCVTSDHTLNRLAVPRLAPEALHDLLRDTCASHLPEKEEMFDELVDSFPRWITLLLEGFSILLCGVGSKKKLLTQLQQDYLTTSNHLVINGFFPSLTLRSIMTSIFQEILCLSSYPQSLNEQLKYLRKHFNSDDCDRLFLIVNNLDGPMMRNHKMQHSLSQLSSLKNVHLIASVDHINSPLLLEGTKLSLYNALWFDATTLLPYSEETSYENSLLVQQSGDLAFSSLIHVFKSLTPNAKGIFTLLAKHKLEYEDDPTYTGLSFGDLYKLCREKFLVNSDLTLRAQLTEFKDHKLIQAKKSFDGVENIFVALNTTTLKDFLDMEES